MAHAAAHWPLLLGQGSHSLEGPLGVKKNFSAQLCPSDSGKNVLVCLGLAHLPCSLGGLHFPRHQESCSPPPQPDGKWEWRAAQAEATS